MPHAVFISHSSQDKAAADQVCATLEARGLGCWIAPRDVRPGTPYAAEIIQAIEEARVLVLLHSKASNASSQVLKEIERADAKGLAILSVRIEACPLSRSLEYFLSAVQWLDATRPPLEDHLEPLAGAVLALVQRQAEAGEGASPPLRSEGADALQRTPTKKARPRRALMYVGAVLLGLVPASLAVWRSLDTPVSSSETRDAPVAANRPVRVIDLPLPETSVPQARTEYSMGLQLVRDDSWQSAASHFEHAAQLDPGMAPAHLRAALYDQESRRQATNELATATALRTRLDEHDRALIEALEPEIGRLLPDFTLAVERLRAVHARFPLDVEIANLLAVRLVNDPSQGPAAARAVTELDPQDANGWENMGRSLAFGGEVPQARAAFERCATVSTESLDCLAWLAALDAVSGRCAEMEAESRREADGSPSEGNAKLAWAQVALGRPEAVVRQTIDATMAAKKPEERPLLEHVLEIPFALQRGRFGDALDLVSRESQAMQASATRWQPGHAVELTVFQMQALHETGDDRAMHRVAQAAMENMDPSVPDSRRFLDASGFWWIARVAGSPFADARRSWSDAFLKSGGPGSFAWELGWGESATTPTEAQEALHAIETDHRLSLPRGYEYFGHTPSWSGQVIAVSPGHVYLLAGRPGDAIPFLRHEVDDCFALVLPVEHVQARLDLGDALQQTGDTRGACESYAKVVVQWGHAQPRSVSAEKARDAMKRLRCQDVLAAK